MLGLFFFLRLYLFTFRERGRKGEREGEKQERVRDTLIVCLSHAPNWGLGPKPRHVLGLGLEPATFQFTGYRPVH